MKSTLETTLTHTAADLEETSFPPPPPIPTHIAEATSHLPPAQRLRAARNLATKKLNLPAVSTHEQDRIANFMDPRKTKEMEREKWFGADPDRELAYALFTGGSHADTRAIAKDIGRPLATVQGWVLHPMFQSRLAEDVRTDSLLARMRRMAGNRLIADYTQGQTVDVIKHHLERKERGEDLDPKELAGYHEIISALGKDFRAATDAEKGDMLFLADQLDVAPSAITNPSDANPSAVSADNVFRRLLSRDAPVRKVEGSTEVEAIRITVRGGGQAPPARPALIEYHESDKEVGKGEDEDVIDAQWEETVEHPMSTPHPQSLSANITPEQKTEIRHLLHRAMEDPDILMSFHQDSTRAIDGSSIPAKPSPVEKKKPKKGKRR